MKLWFRSRASAEVTTTTRRASSVNRSSTSTSVRRSRVKRSGVVHANGDGLAISLQGTVRFPMTLRGANVRTLRSDEGSGLTPTCQDCPATRGEIREFRRD
jgi:hypothetical protein